MQLVWFKRDLRLRDAPAVAEALAAPGPHAFLYVWEPEWFAHPTWSLMHARFVAESLDDLRAALAERGAELIECTGSAAAAFAAFERWAPPGGIAVHSTQEVGLRWTFDRDRAMARWFRERGWAWHDHVGSGVQRGRTHREHWLEEWRAFVSAPEVVPEWGRLQPFRRGGSEAEPGLVWGRPELPPEAPGAPRRQPGGEAAAQAYLRSFLATRARHYAGSISKPEASRTGCSRISPYLAWGNLSVRTAYGAARQAAAAPGAPRRALAAFAERLRWRDHFIQKFESECRMETGDVNRAIGEFEAPRVLVPERVRAWEEGRTGVPLVDACMRCLAATGYLNFRMRAMLVSYLTHHLWQPWQAGADHLARIMLDFEPGIHYPQMQMQAGCTGVTTVRIYNPVKQAQDHDPDGAFIRRWVPELADLPVPAVFAPWEMPPLEAAFFGPTGYPAPLVELEAAARAARERLWGARKKPAVRTEGARIVARHVLPRKKRTGKK
jgi:deoxyribodipyrimidine photo-lyase